MELCETDVQKFLDRDHGNVLNLYENSIVNLCKGAIERICIHSNSEIGIFSFWKDCPTFTCTTLLTETWNQVSLEKHLRLFLTVGNILLKLDYKRAKWIVKFADFGLSKFMKTEESTMTYVGTALYEGTTVWLVRL